MLYVLVALIDELKFRKLAWATSMVGVIGWVLVAVKAIGQLFVLQGVVSRKPKTKNRPTKKIMISASIGLREHPKLCV